MTRGWVMLLLALASCAPARYVGANPEASREQLAKLAARIAALRESSEQVTSGPERRRKRVAIADEICRCAERICVLAGEIAEDSARQSCGRARGDCQRARADAIGCK